MNCRCFYLSEKYPAEEEITDIFEEICEESCNTLEEGNLADYFVDELVLLGVITAV